MLNMFLSAFGWADGTDPFGCPGLEPFISEIENHRWSIDGRAQRDTVDIHSAAELYNSAETEQYRFIKNEFSATELNAAELNGHSSGENEPERRILPEVDSAVEELLSAKALEADFGTLCHRIIEWVVKNRLWDSFPDAESLNSDIRPWFRKFDDREWPAVIEAALGLASGFFKSETWKRASVSKSFESELSFTARSHEGGRETFINGVIDFVFENDDSVEIVDFKTDRRIIPGEYDKQMQIYINAAQAIFMKPARCSLYYLRSGDEITTAD
jgi:ATP-dependent exoDNAse (exonuclease V) beta subunit